MDTLNADAARSLVCDKCWNGFFARANFRSAWESPGTLREPELRCYNYTSRWSEIDASRQAGCNWCSLLLSSAKGDADGYPISSMTLKIQVSFEPPFYAGKDIIGAQHVRIRVDDSLGGHEFRWPIYTSLRSSV